MIEKQIEELLAQLISKKVSKKNVLLVLTCANDYEKEVKELLAQMQSECHYYLIFSDSFKVHMDTESWKSLGSEITDFASFRNMINKIDLVIIPFLTRNSLAKLALGIADTFSLVALQHCMLSGKKMIAFENSWDVTNEVGKIKGLNNNPNYTAMLLKYKEQLNVFGVVSVKLSEAKHQIKELLFHQLDESRTTNGSSDQLPKPTVNQSILTLEDVKNNPDIKVSAESKMTDLAREYLMRQRREIE